MCQNGNEHLPRGLQNLTYLMSCLRLPQRLARTSLQKIQLTRTALSWRENMAIFILGNCSCHWAWNPKFHQKMRGFHPNNYSPRQLKIRHFVDDCPHLKMDSFPPSRLAVLRCTLPVQPPIPWWFSLTFVDWMTWKHGSRKRTLLEGKMSFLLSSVYVIVLYIIIHNHI